MIKWTEKDEAKLELTKKMLARLKERKRLANELKRSSKSVWASKGNSKYKSSFSDW